MGRARVRRRIMPREETSASLLCRAWLRMMAVNRIRMTMLCSKTCLRMILMGPRYRVVTYWLGKYHMFKFATVGLLLVNLLAQALLTLKQAKAF